MQPRPKVSDSIKSELKSRADEVVKHVIQPKYLKPLPAKSDFGYLVDVYTKWNRNYYFYAKYNCPSKNDISPSFGIKLASMVYIG